MRGHHTPECVKAWPEPCICGEDERRRSVPGPPPPPSCRECESLPTRGHAPDCGIGNFLRRRHERAQGVIDTLTAAVNERRKDDAFMERLARRVQDDRHILDQLASQ